MTIKELTYKVKVKLQELTPYGSGLAVVDPSENIETVLTDGLVVLEPERYDKPVEIYIKECIEDAYIELVNLAPSNLLPTKEFDLINTEIRKRQDGSGIFRLPNDFFKLIRLKMIGWERPVLNTINTDDNRYQEQFNSYIRGGFSTPICAIIKDDKGKLIEYFSLPKHFTKHTIEYGYYTPKLSISNGDNDTIVNLDNNILSVLIYLIVSRVQLIYEQVELSNKTRQTALEQLEVIKSNQ